jgi:ElaB/YqjD/DUF883 family membrane-anchored ribosome-binding protein
MNTRFPFTVASDRTIANDEFSRDLHTLLDDAQELLRLTSTQAGEGIADVHRRLHESLAKAREQIGHLGAEASEAAHSIASATEQCVRESPWKSLGAAVATGAVTGLLIGVLIGRR